MVPRGRLGSIDWILKRSLKLSVKSKLSVAASAFLVTLVVFLISLFMNGIYEFSASVPYTATVLTREVLDRIKPESRVFIAMNQINSGIVLPSLLGELRTVISVLGHERVFVSAFASQSQDDTSAQLNEFRRWLDRNRVPNNIVVDGLVEGHSERPSNWNRIQWLSAVRNKAIDHLGEASSKIWSSSMPEDIQVLFVNDVFVSAGEIFHLLATRGMDYDAVCGLDLHAFFYDNWVTRDRNGYSFSSYYPYVKDVESQESVRRGEPFPVNACWNGIAVLNAKPFLVNNVKFRWEDNFDGHLECAQSECYYVHKDFRDAGYGKIYINPQVRVAYEKRWYDFHHYSLLEPLFRAFFSLVNIHCYRIYIWMLPVRNSDECLFNTAKTENGVWMFVAVVVSLTYIVALIAIAYKKVRVNSYLILPTNETRMVSFND